MDRTLRRSAQSQGRRGRLGRADPVLGDPKLRAAGDGEFAGLSGAIRRRNAAADRGRPASRRGRGIEQLQFGGNGGSGSTSKQCPPPDRRSTVYRKGDTYRIAYLWYIAGATGASGAQRR